MPKEIKTFKKVPKYRLEKYTGRNSRHTCPQCNTQYAFARFIDVTTGEYFADDTGRCNREGKCGYVKPVQADGKEIMVLSTNVKKEYLDSDITHTIPDNLVFKSINEEENFFIDYLYNTFDKDLVNKILKRYFVGTSQLWYGSTIFWQIDQNFKVRTGKVMLYDRQSLKRVKQPFNHISWVHNPKVNKEFGEHGDYSLTQCFFGEHLLNNKKFTTFGVVESEKTAILCSLMNPEIGWIATGGVQNINETRMLPFKEKSLVFYPDKGTALKVWEEKLKPFLGDYNFKINKSIESIEELDEGDDMGDYVILKNTKG